MYLAYVGMQPKPKPPPKPEPEPATHQEAAEAPRGVATGEAPRRLGGGAVLPLPSTN